MKTEKFMNEFIDKQLENGTNSNLDKEYEKYVNLYEEKFDKKVFIPEPGGTKEIVIFAIKESLIKNEDLLNEILYPSYQENVIF